MKRTTELKIQVTEVDKASELNEIENKLLEIAKMAALKAYAIYSKFQVGCAILLDNGEIVSGNNQENIAYPSGLCAERVALFHAHAMFPNAKIECMVVVAHFNGKYTINPVYPCGACRQVILETEMRNQSPVKIIMVGESKIQSVQSIKDILPLTFEEFTR